MTFLCLKLCKNLKVPKNFRPQWGFSFTFTVAGNIDVDSKFKHEDICWKTKQKQKSYLWTT